MSDVALTGESGPKKGTRADMPRSKTGEFRSSPVGSPRKSGYTWNQGMQMHCFPASSFLHSHFRSPGPSTGVTGPAAGSPVPRRMSVALILLNRSKYVSELGSAGTHRPYSQVWARTGVPGASVNRSSFAAHDALARGMETCRMGDKFHLLISKVRMDVS